MLISFLFCTFMQSVCYKKSENEMSQFLHHSVMIIVALSLELLKARPVQKMSALGVICNS